MDKPKPKINRSKSLPPPSPKKNLNKMKIYKYYLKGNQVNGQFNCKPEWFKFKIMKYAAAFRLWRFQICIRY
jgi:hypothetical protein